MIKTIRETTNGKVFTCNKCNKIHVEFMNLYFSFTESEYTQFANYMQRLDGYKWEKRNADVPTKRKIYVPIGHKNLTLILSTGELLELKSLLSPSLKKANATEKVKAAGVEFVCMLN